MNSRIILISSVVALTFANHLKAQVYRSPIDHTSYLGDTPTLERTFSPYSKILKHLGVSKVICYIFGSNPHQPAPDPGCTDDLSITELDTFYLSANGEVHISNTHSLVAVNVDSDLDQFTSWRYEVDSVDGAERTRIFDPEDSMIADQRWSGNKITHNWRTSGASSIYLLNSSGGYTETDRSPKKGMTIHESRLTTKWNGNHYDIGIYNMVNCSPKVGH